MKDITKIALITKDKIIELWYVRNISCKINAFLSKFASFNLPLPSRYAKSYSERYQISEMKRLVKIINVI